MILAPRHLPSERPANPIRPRPSGESSWELMRHFARLHLARHEQMMHVGRRFARFMAWSPLSVGLALLVVAALTGDAQLVLSAVLLPFAGAALVACVLRPELLRYDRTRRPELERELRKLEGEVPEEI